MTKLVITKEIEDEIDLLYLAQPDHADAVEVLLELLYENADLLEHLHKPNSYPLHTPAFEVKNFVEAQNNGFFVFSVKFKDLDGYHVVGYRIFLGFNAQLDIYYALALTDRAHAYDTSHPAYGNLCSRYDQCGIPKIP